MFLLLIQIIKKGGKKTTFLQEIILQCNSRFYLVHFDLLICFPRNKKYTIFLFWFGTLSHNFRFCQFRLEPGFGKTQKKFRFNRKRLVIPVVQFLPLQHSLNCVGVCYCTAVNYCCQFPP